MCFWLFSFEKVIDEKIGRYVASFQCRKLELLADGAICPHSRFGTIPLLSDVARRAVKEKVVRVILSAFRVSTLFPRLLDPSLSPTFYPLPVEYAHLGAYREPVGNAHVLVWHAQLHSIPHYHQEVLW